MRSDQSDTSDVLRFGSVVSRIQCAVFVVIGVSAAMLGVDNLVDLGFASLPSSNLALFRLLCGAFVAIAVLGLGITPAERRSVSGTHAGWAAFGANLAYLGHAGTIGFFTWWLVATRDGPPSAEAESIAPLEWGAAFELLLVGSWVWIMAGLIRNDRRWPRGFVWLSVAKATSFWLAYVALLTQSLWFVVIAVGTVTVITGPAWHAWIARIFQGRDREEA